MTASDPPLLSVRSTADLIAAVPYVLGFHPADSVVVVALRGRRVIFAARGDLPAPGTASTATGTAAYIAAVVARQGAEAAMVIGYGPAERVTPAVDAVRAALHQAGLQVLDALRVTGRRYWSYLCGNPECCPPGGTPYDPAASQVAAAATYAGQVALPDRAALARQIAPVGGPTRESMRQATVRAGRRLGGLLGEARPVDVLGKARPVDLLGGRVLRRAGELAVREAVDRHRQRGRLTDDEVAWLSLLLTHLPVRDHAWEHIGAQRWHVALWTEVVRRAEPDLVAAPASLLAFAAWRVGQVPWQASLSSGRCATSRTIRWRCSSTRCSATAYNRRNSTGCRRRDGVPGVAAAATGSGGGARPPESAATACPSQDRGPIAGGERTFCVSAGPYRPSGSFPGRRSARLP